MRKSTERMETQVATIIAARYVVRNGWIGRDSGFPEVRLALIEASLSGCREGFALGWVRVREKFRKIRSAGEARRRLSSKGAEE